MLLLTVLKKPCTKNCLLHFCFLSSTLYLSPCFSVVSCLTLPNRILSILVLNVYVLNLLYLTIYVSVKMQCLITGATTTATPTLQSTLVCSGRTGISGSGMTRSRSSCLVMRMFSTTLGSTLWPYWIHHRLVQ